MSKITVKNQKQWEEVPKGFDGYVYIQDTESCIIIAERKGLAVVAWENSSVEAWENSSVEAWENSSVEAWGNSSVVAWGNSSVEAWENVQITKYSDYAKLRTQGNARIVTHPDTIQEYCDFYGITVKDGLAILYKAVRNDYGAFYDRSFGYKIGETFNNSCNGSRDVQCSFGLHVSHLGWALDFGRSNDIDDFRILECAVPLDKIVIPKNTDGKIRTAELMVLREVSLEECGLTGKILAKRRKAKVKVER